MAEIFLVQGVADDTQCNGVKFYENSQLIFSQIQIFYDFLPKIELLNLIVMWGACHFDRTSNDEFGGELFVFVIFSADIKIRSERSSIHSKLSLFWAKASL